MGDTGRAVGATVSGEARLSDPPGGRRTPWLCRLPSPGARSGSRPSPRFSRSGVRGCSSPLFGDHCFVATGFTVGIMTARSPAGGLVRVRTLHGSGVHRRMRQQRRVSGQLHRRRDCRLSKGQTHRRRRVLRRVQRFGALRRDDPSRRIEAKFHRRGDRRERRYVARQLNARRFERVLHLFPWRDVACDTDFVIATRAGLAHGSPPGPPPAPTPPRPTPSTERQQTTHRPCSGPSAACCGRARGSRPLAGSHWYVYWVTCLNGCCSMLPLRASKVDSTPRAQTTTPFA